MKRLWHRVVRLWQRLPRVKKILVLVAGLMVIVAVTTSQVVLWRSLRIRRPISGC
jgi:hypothetical protein